NVELYRVTLDTQSEQLSAGPPGAMHYHPAPSPDGKWLVYGSKRDGVRQLYVMRLSDKKEWRITDLTKGRAAMWPSWQPASKKQTASPRAMQGEWVGTAAEWAGKAVPNEIARRMKVTVKEMSITISPLSYQDDMFHTRGEPAEFSYRIDPTKNPKAIDLILKDSEGEHRQLGIYHADEGQLKLCWQHDGKQRPTEFKTAAEPTQMLSVLTRSQAEA